jgi:hypothetical protein
VQTTKVDYTSVNALADLFHQLTDAGIDVFFAHAKAPVGSPSIFHLLFV